MDDEFKQLKERVIAETDAWLQRVARECGASFGNNNLETIERTLNAQRQRIADLEAQAAKEAQETIAMEAELYERIVDLEAERNTLRVELETTQQAREREQVRVKELETLLTSGETLYDANAEIKARERAGWEFRDLILQHNGHWAIVMQRPARPAESEGSE